MKAPLSLIVTLLATAPLGVFATGSATSDQTAGSSAPTISTEVTTPAYPSEARLAGVEGTVMVECLVAADGTILTSAIADPDAHPLLREAALKRVAQVRLESLDGNNANSYKVVRIPVRFELESLNARVDTAHIAAR